MTPNRPDRHLQDLTDLVRIHVFTEAKHENRTRRLRKRSNQALQPLLKQRIGLGHVDRNFRQLVHLDLVPETRPPQRIDAAMDGAPAQPGDAMGTEFDRQAAFKELQKDVLCDFFRDRIIPEVVTGNAVNHSLMLVYRGFEFGLCHLPSKLITARRGFITQKVEYDGQIMETQPVSNSREVGQWALFLHLSQLAGFVIPFAGWIAPIVIWQVKKEEMPELDAHGKVVTNWILSSLIYATVCVILMFVVIGIPLILVLLLLGIIFPIIGGIKASNGEVWKYPMSIRFF
jgi:uncharacterized Tic20 family protein